MQKIKNFLVYVKSFILNYSIHIWYFLLIISICVNIYVLSLDYISGDLKNFLLEWMDEIKAKGHWNSLEYEIGNYNMLYQYILVCISYLPESTWPDAIKLISMIFQVGIGFAAGMIVNSVKPDVKGAILKCVTLSLLCPTFILNASYWAQCDSIYAFFILLTLIFLFRNKQICAMVMFGIAFSFKLQSVFIVPFLIMLCFKHQLSWWKMIIIPIFTHIITLVPAWFAGHDAHHLFTIYLDQTSMYWGRFPGMMNLFGLYLRTNLPLTPTPLPFTLGALFIVAVFALYFLRIKKIYNNYDMSAICLFMLVITVFVLPTMHERYMFAADALAIPMMIIGCRRWLIPGTLIVMTSLLNYLIYFSSYCRSHNKYYYFIFLVFVAAIITTFIATKNTLKKDSMKKVETS